MLRILTPCAWTPNALYWNARAWKIREGGFWNLGIGEWGDGRSQIPILTFSNSPVLQFPHSPIPAFPNSQIPPLADFSIAQYPNARCSESKCQVSGSAMRNVRAWGWGEFGNGELEKMWQAHSLIIQFPNSQIPPIPPIRPFPRSPNLQFHFAILQYDNARR